MQSCNIVNDIQMHVNIVEKYHNFIVPQNQCSVINMLIAQSVTSEIKIYCDQAVDIVIRLIILFPHIADINLSIMMCGESSKVAVVSLCALTEEQSVIIKTQQIHCGKKSHSSFILQGLLAGRSSLVYDGTIRIEKDACGTYALQNNKNILLSSTATAVSIPNIEVLHHDVQCYHGAAIGKFDAHHMQYMQCRGLNELQIKQLLVQELFAQVLQGYEKREFILQKVYEKI